MEQLSNYIFDPMSFHINLFFKCVLYRATKPLSEP